MYKDILKVFSNKYLIIVFIIIELFLIIFCIKGIMFINVYKHICRRFEYIHCYKINIEIFSMKMILLCNKLFRKLILQLETSSLSGQNSEQNSSPGAGNSEIQKLSIEKRLWVKGILNRK